jgi:hypothetical protein
MVCCRGEIMRAVWVGLGSVCISACMLRRPPCECPPGLPQTLNIDDFEDKDDIPVTPLLAQWQCYLYNTPESRAGDPPREGSLRCWIGQPGFNSNYGQVVALDLQDLPDGNSDYVGAGLRTITKAGTLDVSGYRRITFSAKLESSVERPLPKGTKLDVGLTCPAVSEGSVPGGFSIRRQVAAGSDWATFAIDLADFSQPPGPSHTFDPKRCLTLLTGVTFQVQPTLADGAYAAAKLSVDTVYLQ